MESTLVYSDICVLRELILFPDKSDSRRPFPGSSSRWAVGSSRPDPATASSADCVAGPGDAWSETDRRHVNKGGYT